MRSGKKKSFDQTFKKTTKKQRKDKIHIHLPDLYKDRNRDLKVNLQKDTVQRTLKRLKEKLRLTTDDVKIFLNGKELTVSAYWDMTLVRPEISNITNSTKQILTTNIKLNDILNLIKYFSFLP